MSNIGVKEVTELVDLYGFSVPMEKSVFHLSSASYEGDLNICLVCCGSTPELIIYFALSESLSITLKERCIHVYLACLLWQYPLIDIYFA